MKNKTLALAFCLLISSLIVSGHAEASPGQIARGAARTFLSVFEIPRTMVEHSRQVVFPFGIVTGAMAGTARMLFGTVAGATEMAVGAAPYAKYAVFLI